MTWDQLIGKIREGLGESNAQLRIAGNFLAKASENGGVLDGEKVGAALALLVLAVSNLHSAVASMYIGLDAVIQALCEADKSQEVKGE